MGTNVRRDAQTVAWTLVFVALLGVTAPAFASNQYWTSLGADHWTDGRVLALVEWRGWLIAAGEFTSASGKPAHNIARWDGAEWHRLGDGLGWDFEEARVASLVVYDDLLIAGGQFYGAGEDPNIWHIAAWDGRDWIDLGADLPVVSRIHCMTVYGPDLIVSGDFDAIGAREASRIARYNGGWQPMGQGLDSSARDMIPFDGELVVGGVFTTADGLPRPKIARWVNGRWESMGAGFQVDGTLPASVFALEIFNGELIAGGFFRSSGTESVRGVARWTEEGWKRLPGGGIDTLDGNFWAWDMHAFEDRLYVGGNIDTAGGVAVDNIAAWNGGEWAALGDGAGSFVRDMVTYSEKLFVGGEFKRVGGQTAHFLGAWNDGPLSLDPPDESDDLPELTVALQNVPNPFNPATTIRFTTHRDGPIRLDVVDLRGSLVSTLVDESRPAGNHEVLWNGLDGKGRPVASGVYLAQLRADQRRRSIKMTLVR